MAPREQQPKARVYTSADVQEELRRRIASAGGSAPSGAFRATFRAARQQPGGGSPGRQRPATGTAPADQPGDGG